MEENILFTLKYFDMFDYPLRLEEVRKWVFDITKIRNLSAEQVERKLEVREDLLERLEKLIKLNRIESDGEFYFLSGRSGIVGIRKKREKVSLKKIKKAQRMARLLAKVPWVQMICVVSNLGYLNAEKEADIDFFIVTDKNRIWVTRFWCVALMKLLNQRPSKRITKDKICLSYFVDEDHLNLESTKVVEPDVHLLYLLSQYMPIYVEYFRRKTLAFTLKITEDIWKRFKRENRWINKYLPNFNYGEIDERFVIKPSFTLWKEIARKMTYDFDEKFYKWIQMRILPQHLRAGLARNDKSVIIKRGVLKLHSNDKRRFFNRRLFEVK